MIDSSEHFIVLDGQMWKLRRVWINGEFVGQYLYQQPLPPPPAPPTQGIYSQGVAK